MSTPDRITLRGLTVRGNHGVFDFEKREGQDFVIDVVLHTSVAAAAASDDIDDTIHYGDLAEAVAAIVEDNTFDLIETLAERIAEHCLTLCGHVEVVVHKPSAPIQRTFSDVSVTVVRRREAEAEGGPAGAVEAGAVETGAAEPRAADTAGRTEAEALLSLGANLGDAMSTLDEAIEALDRHPRITVRRRSSVYRTAPWGGIEQNDFHNLSVLVDTSLTATELLAVGQGIEVACGRTRELRWGPRTLDIDLIRFASAGHEMVVDTETLTLPHPRAHERAFVLAPWAELEPEALVLTPTGRQPIGALLETVDDQEISRIPAE